MYKPWTLEEAVILATYFEKIAPRFNCHVALTGGVLYKEGRRKDADFLFYRVRQAQLIDDRALLDALCEAIPALTISWKFSWGWKMVWQGRSLDVFFPDLYNEVPKESNYT